MNAHDEELTPFEMVLVAERDEARRRVAHLEAGITAAVRKYAFVSPVTFELKKLLGGGQR